MLNQQPAWIQYPVRRRAGNQPEELIGAACGLFLHGAITHAQEAGFTPTSIDTTADVSLDKVGGLRHYQIASQSKVAVADIDLQLSINHPESKAGCPVSRVLNAEITLDYQLNA